ncbi:protocadherin Fat 3 isoform X2 [Nematostella vectensis]|uniref:protocadherin Fat 3 isoform X2 n=1 Tax=Nematostella vectensis TaxID=45351 RepID=UPI00207716C5|nr:protocadherin Fat 3 isoform X2 [Nematostella vectensis]
MMKEAIEREITEIFEKDVTLKAYFRGCTLLTLRAGSVMADVQLWMSPQFTGSLSDMTRSFIDGLNSTNDGGTYLGSSLRVTTPTVSDYNECENNDQNCHRDAECVNELGKFSCKCNDGFDGDGVSCKPGFVKTFWWVVILLGLVLLVVIIIIAILIIRKPKYDARYGLEDDETKLSRRSSNATSNLSYRDGDVYYRDTRSQVRSMVISPNESSKGNLGRNNPVYEGEESGDTIAMGSVSPADNGSAKYGDTIDDKDQM